MTEPGPVPRGRPLTPVERDLLGGFREAVTLDRVRIYSDRTRLGRLVCALSRGAAVALGYRVVLPAGSRLPVLAHEMAHVAQYEAWGALRYYFTGFLTQILHRTLLGRNVYRWDAAEGRPFEAYGMEQQGQIVQDCYDPTSPRHKAAMRVSPFRPYHLGIE